MSDNKICLGAIVGVHGIRGEVKVKCFSDNEKQHLYESSGNDKIVLLTKADVNKYFDSEIDLSLQLLQLYWGEGFSLTDLANQFNGRNIQGTMERLNIPRVDRGYGIYLKLSDNGTKRRCLYPKGTTFRRS